MAIDSLCVCRCFIQMKLLSSWNLDVIIRWNINGNSKMKLFNLFKWKLMKWIISGLFRNEIKSAGNMKGLLSLWRTLYLIDFVQKSSDYNYTWIEPKFHWIFLLEILHMENHFDKELTAIQLSEYPTLQIQNTIFHGWIITLRTLFAVCISWFFWLILIHSSNIIFSFLFWFLLFISIVHLAPSTLCHFTNQTKYHCFFNLKTLHLHFEPMDFHLNFFFFTRHKFRKRIFSKCSKLIPKIEMKIV